MPGHKGGYVYIITNRKEGTLYIGVTSDLIKRIYEHKSKKYPGFSKRYNLDLLVWFEQFPTIEQAIEYEKKLKMWKRQWKLNLINQSNPEWNDLYLEITA